MNPVAFVPLILTPLYLVLAHQHARAGRTRWAWVMAGMAFFYPIILLGFGIYRTVEAIQ